MRTSVASVKLYIAFCFIACTIVTACRVNAEAYIPSYPDYIIAEWSESKSEYLRRLQVQSRLQPADEKTISALANHYLQLAAQPGQSRLYGLAEAVLKPLIETNTNDTDVLLAWAQVQQHQHNFALALSVLEKIMMQAPDNITANLLAARLQLVQGNSTVAQEFCVRLLGRTDLLTLSTCSLEVRSTLGEKELAESYAQLQQLLISQGLPNDERQVWLLQILADMALRLEKPQEAIGFLARITKKNSLSVWVQWSDIQLVLGNAQAVIDELTTVVKSSPQADDALLLRLAIAEKKLTAKNYWQHQLAERIALRERRDDQAHAADLARYYLDVAPDADKALYWAERNWQQAREVSDKNLLEKARQFADVHNREAY